MPRRVVKPYLFEAETERQPLSPSVERRLLKLAQKRAPLHIQNWHKAETELEKFYAAPRAAMAAINVGDTELAAKVAADALDLAPSFKENWNYGIALHFGHAALGMLAASDGDIRLAVAHLEHSGRAPRSPQLNSFGLSMQLARELLLHGEAAAVLAYFQECRRFWAMGGTWLNIWEKKVARGALPNFFMHRYR